MPEAVRHQLGILFIGVVVLFFHLGTPKLWDRDEPRNARCAVEMLEQGDWVVPMFNQELRTHKPILLYWLMMTAYSVFGVNEWSARFWSVVLGLGTVLLTYHLGRRLFNPKVGLWGAMILLSTIMFNVASRAATPDSSLIFFSALALLIYVLGTFKPVDGGAIDDLINARDTAANQSSEPTSFDLSPLRVENVYFPSSWPVVALMYATMGVAMLAKGPVGLVLPTAVIGMFLLIMRLPPRESVEPSPSRWKRGLIWGLALLRPFEPRHFLRTCWAMRPITALAMSLAVAAPWYIVVGIRTHGQWLQGFFLTHNLSRAVKPMEGHWGPMVLYYLVVLMVGFFPWSVFFTPTLVDMVRRISKRDRWTIGYLFVACWASVYVVLFSLAQTKLPSYITPIYPAVALMTACFLYHWIGQTAYSSEVWMRRAFVTLLIVGVGIGIGLPIAATYLLPGEQWLGIFGLIPFLGGSVCLVLLKHERRLMTAAAFTMTSILFVTSIFGVATVQISQHRKIGVLLDVITTNHPHAQLASFNCSEPSWVFYAKRPIRPVDFDQAVSFLQADPNRVLITNNSGYEELKESLPEGVQVLATTPFFLRSDTLRLLGRENSTATSKARLASKHPKLQ